MSKELLIDTMLFEVKPEQLNELTSPDSNGRLIVKGVIQRANAKNHNGRIYPLEILMRESKKYGEKIKERRALGELDHPESSVVNLSNASHNIVKTYWDKNDLMGEIEILSTPAGNILKELLKAGIKLGISSRGLGSVKEVQLEDNVDSADQVQEDFELIAYDFVSDPSTQGAFMKPVNESKNYTKRKKYSKAEKLISDILSSINER